MDMSVSQVEIIAFQSKNKINLYNMNNEYTTNIYGYWQYNHHRGDNLPGINNDDEDQQG